VGSLRTSGKSLFSHFNQTKQNLY